MLEPAAPKVVVLMVEQKMRYDLKSASLLLDISASTLRSLAISGKIAHHRDGTGKHKKFFFTPKNLREYVAGIKVHKAVV